MVAAASRDPGGATAVPPAARSLPARPGWRLALAAAMLAACALAADAASAPDGFDQSEAAAFLVSLQRAVRDNQPGAVAALVNFPLRVNRSGQSTLVRNADAFARSYAKIFTGEVRAAVLEQDASALFRNWQGAMIGSGEVWFSGICTDRACSGHRLAVISVNVPK